MQPVRAQMPSVRQKDLAFQHAEVDPRGPQRGAGGAGAGLRAPARAPGRRRLVAGRAADERDDGRRGHAPAGVPRASAAPRRPSARPPGSAPSSARTAPGRTSTAAPASCRRRSRPTGRCAWRATRPRRSTCARPPRSSARRAGSSGARVFTHLWLALFGLWSWERVPALPPEIVLLPSWVPLNVYDFACWARQTIVALSLVKAHRPVRALPFDLDELRCRRAPPAAGAAPSSLRGRLLRRPGPRAACLRAPPARARCAGWRWRAPSAGSCAARRPTARGAGSSRRGCTR